jgi:ABC-type sugar transport system ATPase subunit
VPGWKSAGNNAEDNARHVSFFSKAETMDDEKNRSVLEIKGVSKEFPGVRALNGIDMRFKAGEVHALVGENGAGKSTLMKILSGVYRPNDGRIVFKGKEYKVKNPYEAQQAGISIIYQEFSLIRTFTVLENVFLNREPSKAFGFLNLKEARSRLEALLEEMNIELDVNAVVGTLSVVKQQVTEILKALSVDASVLIMDEPTSSLTDVEVKKLFDIIRYLKKKGVTVIYISHMLDEVFQIADRVTVLKDGEVMGTRNIDEIDKSELVRMMVGRKIEDYYPPLGGPTLGGVSPEGQRADVMLEVKKLDLRGNLHDVSFCVYCGEVLGIAGLMGSGRSELVECILGLRQRTGGEIRLQGKPVRFAGVREAISSGIGFISEDRKNKGILGPLTVLENISIATLPRYTNAGVLDKRKERKDGQAQVDALRIKVSSLSQAVGELSGGNQQKVLISRWLLRSPRLYIFSEPTRGIDVGAKVEIYKIIRELTSRGNSAIIVSSELPEIIGMSDRILVMHAGRLGGVLDQSKTTATEEEIMSIAVGHSFSIREV